jgi:hypothetical protein
MRAPWARRTGPATVGPILCAAIALSLLVGCVGERTGTSESPNSAEEARVTSPEGQFDAVMTRKSVGGVLGGVYWSVFIVPKGTPAPNDDDHTLLYAAVLRGEMLAWKHPHLLEIHYNLAHIEQFRNLWGSNELQGRGWRKGDYLVEVRLVPSSPDFSFLTPDGDFIPRE